MDTVVPEAGSCLTGCAILSVGVTEIVASAEAVVPGVADDNGSGASEVGVGEKVAWRVAVGSSGVPPRQAPAANNAPKASPSLMKRNKILITWIGDG